MRADRCDITVHAIGPKDVGLHLTLEVDSPYDEAFVRALKRLPPSVRAWQDPPGRWWIAGSYRELLCQLALAHYAAVYLIEGRAITNVRTGFRQEQLGLDF